MFLFDIIETRYLISVNLIESDFIFTNDIWYLFQTIVFVYFPP